MPTLFWQCGRRLVSLEARPNSSAKCSHTLLIPFYVGGLTLTAVGYYHDDGIYVATAKALAEGRGYRLIDLPGDPPQTKYPILFPAILAALWQVFTVFLAGGITVRGYRAEGVSLRPRDPAKEKS